MTQAIPRFLQLQQTRNTRTRDGWHSFASHRQQVMELLRPEDERASGRLCLLGAGNCNDVDLQVLASQYARIALVDWDEGAMAHAVSRYWSTSPDSISLHSADLTAIGAELSRYDERRPPDDAQLDDLCRRAQSAELPPGAGQADVVASLCVISQLVEIGSASLGPRHPRLVELVRSLRLGHLRQVAAALRSEGTGVIITDLVSSDTAPELLRVSSAELPALLHQLLSQGNYFLGLHPQLLIQDLAADPGLSAMVHDCRITSPWLWEMGNRRYAVFALVFRVKSTVVN